MQKKKQYLKKYLIAQKRIARLSEMALQNPKNKKDYSNEIKECEALKTEIENKISKVDDELLREVLFLKYTCDKSLSQVSEIISYSRRHTERLHIAALEKFEL